MNAIATITPHMNTITCPDALASLQGWLIWRYEQDGQGGKPRKVPYYPAGGRRHGVQGRPEDRRQLTTFAAAKAAAARRGFDGVGLALMPEFGVVALDFDGCVGPAGLLPEVERLVVGTYAEYSPSGQGVRAFFRGDLGNRKAAGAPYGFETFSSHGFVTVTGNVIEACDLLGAQDIIADATPEVRDLCARRFGPERQDDNALDVMEPRVGLTEAQIAEALDVLDPDMPHDDWLHVGMALHHETDGEGFEAWREWSERGEKYPGDDVLLKRWESFGQPGRRPVTARTLVKLANEHGARLFPGVASVEEFDALADEPAEQLVADHAVHPERFPVIQAAEFAQGKPLGWLIKGVLPRAEVIVLFGESGSGKSFVALDMAMSIARGEPWRGRKAHAGRVAYVAAEGGGGFRKRLDAYARHWSVALTEVPFGVVHAAPSLLQKQDALDLAKSILASGGADLIVVDTFAQVTAGGNENSGEDVGKALAHCRGLHRATGATVILVHHTGKDKDKGARGWSGLRAAADAELEVVRSPGGRYVRITKQKDSDDTGEWGFDLTVIPVGEDEDGEVVDSCVVTEAAVPERASAGPVRKLGQWERLIVEVVSEIALGQSAGIEVKAVVDEALRRSEPPQDGKRDTRRQVLTRAIKRLSEGDDAPYYLDGDCLEVL